MNCAAGLAALHRCYICHICTKAGVEATGSYGHVPPVRPSARCIRYSRQQSRCWYGRSTLHTDETAAYQLRQDMGGRSMGSSSTFRLAGPVLRDRHLRHLNNSCKLLPHTAVRAAWKKSNTLSLQSLAIVRSAWYAQHDPQTNNSTISACSPRKLLSTEQQPSQSFP